jgi:hypothetical protein
MEIWKYIEGYEAHYQVSNLGNVKSIKLNKEKILRLQNGKDGYSIITLCKKGYRKTKPIHKLVAVAFLNHKPNGFESVINHINHNRKDNRVENLEITSQKHNASKEHIKSTSKYVGVVWNKKNKKWIARTTINGHRKYLGYYHKEYEAYLSILHFNNQMKI